jgi:hypothetical protein
MPFDLDQAYASAANEERSDERLRALFDSENAPQRTASLTLTDGNAQPQPPPDQGQMDPGAFGTSPLTPPQRAPTTRFSPSLPALAGRQRPIDFGRPVEAQPETPRPQRPQRYQPFIPSQGPYRPHDWGKPDLALLGSFRYPGLAPSPWMPQHQDVNALMRQVLGFFMQSGSNPIKGMARNLIGLRASTINAFVKGYMQSSKMLHEQAKQQHEEMLERLQEEFADFSKVFISYGPESAKFNEEELKHQLEATARKYQDDELLRALHNGGYGEVQRVIDARHAKGLDAWKVSAQSTKADRDAEADDRNLQPDRPVAPKAATPAGTAAPGAAPGPAGVPATADGMPEFPAPYNSAIRSAATRMFMGHLGSRNPFPTTQPHSNEAAQREEDKLTDYYNNVLSSPNLPSGDDNEAVAKRMNMIMPAMEKISPEMTQRMQYVLAGNELTAKQKSDPGWVAAEGAALKIDPHAASDVGDVKERSLLLAETGDFSLATRGIRASKQGQRTDTAIINGAVKVLQDQHGFTPEEATRYLARKGIQWKNAAATSKAFAVGKQGDQVRALNVAISHLDTLERLGRELDNPTSIRPLNAIFQDVAAATGRTAPVDYNAARQIIGEEIVKSVVSGGGGVTERMEAGRNLDRANTGEQTASIANTYRTLMAGQMVGLEKQYGAGTGFNDFRGLFLLPATQRALEGAVERPVGDFGGGAPGSAPAAPALPPGWSIPGGGAPTAPAAPAPDTGGGLPPGWRIR